MEEQIARAMIIHQMLGTRISDTLTLRKDCLYKHDRQDMIIIYQPKTRRYEKPISRELAQLIGKAVSYANEHYPEKMCIRDRLYTFEQIYQLVWKDYSVGDIKNIIWCLVKRLRKKLNVVEDGAGNCIVSVRDIGYKFELNNENEQQ